MAATRPSSAQRKPREWRHEPNEACLPDERPVDVGGVVGRMQRDLELRMYAGNCNPMAEAGWVREFRDVPHMISRAAGLAMLGAVVLAELYGLLWILR